MSTDALFDEFAEDKINFRIIIQLLHDFPSLKPQIKRWIGENP
jgi:hypothetical protein